MRRILLLLLAIITALCLTEIVVRFVIGFPVYDIAKRLHFEETLFTRANLYKPHSRYWNVEGGNKVFRRNNLGLQGADINTDYEDNIVVLGSSFIEAKQVPTNTMATSVFQQLLWQNEQAYNVVNLGSSGFDPYDAWFRIMLFEQLGIKPNCVFLVLDSDYAMWFNRHKLPLTYEPNSNFGKPRNETKAYRIRSAVRDVSSAANLLAYALNAEGKDAAGPEEKKESDGPTKSVCTENLLNTLQTFHGKYERFAIISIVNDNDFNSDLTSFCATNGIAFYSTHVKRSENCFNGTGHLNETGNNELGTFMYHSFLFAQEFWNP